MNPKIWIPLTAATITGAAAAWAGYELMLQAPAGVNAPQVQLDSVVVATRELPAGTKLRAADLSVVRVERGTMIGTVASNPEALVGRVISAAVAAGQPVSAALLAGEGTVPGLSATLPEGFRAITIHVDPYSGLDGFLYPEAHVDVIAALGSGNDSTARTVAQNVRVLAVAGRVRGDSMEETGEEAARITNEHNVTLMVTPQQAAAIQLACADGTPRLMLRSGTDNEIHAFAGMTLAELRGEAFGDPFEPRSPWEEEPLQVTEPVTTPAGNGPTTRPDQAAPEAPEPASSMPRMHVIEVIRGGVISRTALPLGAVGESKTRARAAPERAVVKTDSQSATE